ncbi:MAG: hypothetical protein JWN32_3752 [Solirubrobacterales bacterium]|nr:hypothetical protein [Solirubrobacterales bacterium]
MAASTTPALGGKAVLLALVLAATIALIFALPGLDDVARRLRDGDPGWLIAATALELASCLGYVVIVQRLFDRVPGRLARRIAWAELGVNSLLPAGGITGLGAGGLAMRARGLPTAWIAERSVVLFLLTSAVNVGAVAVIGVALGVGLIDGPHSPALTFLPAGAAVVTVVAVLLLPLATRGPERPGRVHGALRLGAEGVRGTLTTLSRDGAATGGAVAWWAFDNAVLLAALHAFGAHPGLAAVAMAYLIGMLGNALPLPGGIGAVDGGLLGALVLYGVPIAPAAAAVLVYRAIALWLPAVFGLASMALLRRGKAAEVAVGPPERSMVQP